MNPITFLNRNADFTLANPETVSYLYFPLAGEAGLKSAVSPDLGGDSKLDQESFLLEPVSSENLHNNRSTRNFWVKSGKGCWSVTGASAEQEAVRFTEEQDKSKVIAGLMWHSITRTSEKMKLESTVTSFVPMDETVEVMLVSVKNLAEEAQELTCTAAIPVYGRSADNIRDHRNVTSMLHRIRTTENGVLVKPTMSFDEKGHRANHRIYYVLGCTGEGKAPVSYYPNVEAYLGEGGTFTRPRAVYEGREGVPAGTSVDGREAVGAMKFEPVTLNAGESAEFVILLGIADEEKTISEVYGKLNTADKAKSVLETVKALWQDKVNVRYRTGDENFDLYLRWISFQPFLRRIFGCSFLPHHDYGRGGRGWRDLWQDCLSLLLMEPDQVREMIAANYGGVRIDGTNATIIGTGLGSFIADRNGIARVWMDHALWPLMTTQLYIDQTGDIGILDETARYFKDPQCARGTAIDEKWDESYGGWQKTASGEVYESSILEHMLVQHLTAFYEVGEHNIFRMRGADWNDALDMAAERGESVAFTCAYAGNLRDLAQMLRNLAELSGNETRPVMEEIKVLLNDNTELFDSVERKSALLNAYTGMCSHVISGQKVNLSLKDIADDLDKKADWLMAHLRKQEWLDMGDGEGWFNSYYDNSGNAVEGKTDKGIRMMLTGQVFSIMSGTASEEQVKAIVKSADRYLYREEIGGYRLNTDFNELKFDMGRMFGFAYGEKENGAVFSHMTVMFANALYRRGFAKEGWKALSTLLRACMNFPVSCIYPGVPEYFRADGRGVYHYLTGAASWFMMTVITEMFGVRGELGQMVLEPKLVKEQFDANGEAALSLVFAGKKVNVTYRNAEDKEYGDYRITSATLDSETLAVSDNGAKALAKRSKLKDNSSIVIELS